MERNIFGILHREHEDILSLIVHMEECKGEEQTLFNQLDAELSAHIRGEEVSLYPVMEAIPKAKELIETAKSQHREVATAMSDMHGMAVKSPEWLATLRNIKSRVLTHVTMEENDLFALGRDKLDNIIMEKIVNDFEAEKQRILQGRGAGTR